MEGRELASGVRRKAEEFRRLAGTIDEKTASRAPAGRWSPKEIVSHLCGPEGMGPVALFRLFLDEDVPTIDIEPGNPFFSKKRAQMTYAGLLSEFDDTYSQRADFVAGLSEEQLGRKARIPGLAQSPLGEYPTLGALVQGIGEYHIGFHIDHLKEIIAALKGP